MHFQQRNELRGPSFFSFFFLKQCCCVVIIEAADLLMYNL